MTDYVNQTRGRGEPLPVVANPPTDSRRWLFLKIDHLQFQDGLTFSESIAPNFEVAPSSQNFGVQFRDAGNLSKFVLNFGMPPSSRNRPRSIVRSRGLLQIGGLQFQHGMFSSMHSSKSSRTLAHAWPPACKPARASCTHVLRTRLPAETRAAVQRVLRRCLTLVTAVEL